MGHPGAGSSAAGGQPAGVAVVVPMEATAPVSTRTTWAGSSTTTTTTTTRSPGGALVAPVAAARAAPPAWTRLTARLALAAALFLLGCAAAGLALFAMILPPADSRLLGKACAPPTDAEVASLRTASEGLLLAASAQVVAATMALLVPARVVAFFGNLVGLLTAYHAIDVLVKMVACHGSAHGALGFHFWVLYVVLGLAVAVCGFVSVR